MALSLRPMEILPPEAFVKYSESEEVLVDISGLFSNSCPDGPADVILPGKILRKTGRYAYWVKVERFRLYSPKDKDSFTDELYVPAEFLRKLEKK